MSDDASTSAAISLRATDDKALAPDDGPPRVVELDREVLALEGVRTTLCPQCGVNPAGEPRAWTFRWASPLVSAAWFCGAWMSSITISPFLGLGLLGGAFFARRTLRTKLPLCDDCDRAARRSKRIRTATVLGAFASPLIAGALLVFLNEGGWLTSPGLRGAIMGAIVTAGLAGAVFGHVKTSKSALFISKITKKVLKLKASPTWQKVLADERPRALAAAAPAAEDE